MSVGLLRWFSVQFHPEHMPGPKDLEMLFDVFMDQVRHCKSGKTGSVFCSRFHSIVNKLPVVGFY